MKKLFEDELTLNDVKAMVRGMQKKNRGWVIGLAVLGVAALVAGIVFAVIKLRDHCGCDCDDCDEDYDDDDYDDEDEVDGEEDENGCRYAEEKDFE